MTAGVRLFGYALVAVLAWGVLAFGAVYPWAYWPLAVASATIGVWGLTATHGWRDPRVRELGAALLAIAIAIALQMVALPGAVVARLSPSVELFMARFEMAHQPAAVSSLSLLPTATAVTLALFVSLALLLLGTMRALHRVPLDWLVGQLMGLGAGLAVVGIVQMLFLDRNAPLVYGFWKPLYGATPFGPFINKNHFAGWMVMALPVVIGYAWSLVAPGRRGGARHSLSLRWLMSLEASRLVLMACVVLVMALSVVLTGSRSGLVSLAVALVVIGAFVWGSVRHVGTRLAAASALALVLIGALAWGGADTLMTRFGRAPSELDGRFAAWRDTVRMIDDFLWFGTGMGTYGRAMLVYQTADRSSMYVQAHNDYLQLVAEGGLLVSIPVAVTMILGAGVVRRRVTAGMDDRQTACIRMGAIAGLAGIGAQSLVEFSLQMPGNAVLCVLLLALALHRPSSPSHAHSL